MSLVSTANAVFDATLVMLGGAILLRWALLAILSALDWVGRQAADPLPEPPDGWPMVAVIVPAYNESAVVEAAVHTALQSDYPQLQVIIVDDGSTDDTWEIAERLAEDPRVQALAQRPNQGKPAALDAGMAAAEAEIVVTVDADTVLSKSAVRRLVHPLLLDDGLAAVAGNVKVGNRTMYSRSFRVWSM